MNRLTTAFWGIAGSLWALAAGAALDLPDRPISLGDLAQPMVMITMGRDHTLFALVDGKVDFSIKGPNKRRTVSVVAAE